tara:strand:- start:608 stop:1384 length:777 start_codon:yes stop_codon:yes gene_type:complete
MKSITKKDIDKIIKEEIEIRNISKSIISELEKNIFEMKQAGHSSETINVFLYEAGETIGGWAADTAADAGKWAGGNIMKALPTIAHYAATTPYIGPFVQAWINQITRKVITFLPFVESTESPFVKFVAGVVEQKIVSGEDVEDLLTPEGCNELAYIIIRGGIAEPVIEAGLDVIGSKVGINVEKFASWIGWTYGTSREALGDYIFDLPPIKSALLSTGNEICTVAHGELAAMPGHAADYSSEWIDRARDSIRKAGDEK